MVSRLLEALGNLTDTWGEFRTWQSDWNRTWSPVSYFLAIALLVGFVALVYLFGEEAWHYLATWVRAAV
jgi:hypothetical protein